MRPYEVVVILDATLEDNVINEELDKVVQLVKSREGSVGRIDRWGRRAFAYELQHKNEGYYAFVEIVADTETVAEVDRSLGLADNVLRHRVIRQPERTAGRGEARVASSGQATKVG